MFILDTNVISELRKVRLERADINVAKWAEAQVVTDLYLSVISLQELEIGVLLLERKDPTQGKVLRKWLSGQVIPAFTGRILPIDSAIAQCSARFHVPNPCPVRDTLIAATALVHGMTIVTRNVTDFVSTGVQIINPWEA